VADLDSLPFPDRSLLDYEGYGSQWYGFKLPRMTTAFSSRGCPHSCLFCSDVTLRAPYRARSPENILEELVLVKEQGYEIVVFFDDNLTNDVPRLNRLCGLIIENNLNLILASTGMPHLLPDQTLRLMNRAGFLMMFVGVESGSDAVLRRYRKPGRRDQVAKGIDRAQQAKMFVIGSFITGLREERPADHQATKGFLREVRPVFSDINPLMVHPGSGLWHEIRGQAPPRTLAETASRLVSNYPGQQDKRVIKFRERDFRRAYAKLWWKPGMVLKALRILYANRLAIRLGRSVLGKPSSLFQFWQGGQPR
jgi:radical SAM superfamily enzyme YgiQ (UPF0313 family)